MNLNPKISAAAIAAAATLVIVFVAAELGLVIPPEVASAATLIAAVAVGYLKSQRDWSPR